MKTEMLAARADGLGNILRLGGRHHENDVRRRLFQRLEQRVEGGVGDLVGFVENVDLVAVARRTIPRRLAQLADLINAAVSGSVNLDHIHRAALADFHARIAFSAGGGSGLIGRAAIQCHGQNARHRGFADAAVPAEDVAMRDPLLRDGVFQCAGDMLLPDDFIKTLGPVLAR